MDKQTDKKPQSRRLSGIVTSDKMDKTIVVRLDRRVTHPKYGKFYTKSTKVKAHDAKGLAKIGDVVVIEETRPLSKDKCWRLISVTSQAK